MDLKSRIAVLAYLGTQLETPSEALTAVVRKTYIHNSWFTVENTNKALEGIRTAFLQKEALEKWTEQYAINDSNVPKSLALILAGNIPLVGFHDVLCVFLAGHKAKIKLSEKDKFLLPFLVQIMVEKDPRVESYFEYITRLKGYDAVIATGSNNSARYFDAYFGKYPNIIRRNRNAIAVLDGQENTEQLTGIADDILAYFGLGCRNVAKIYVPKDFNFDPLLEALHEHNHLVMHNKYKNNFDYNYTLIILNKVSYKANGCILLTEDTSLQSRIASLHYEYYTDRASLEKDLQDRKEEIQCVVSTQDLAGWKVIPPGKAQKPALTDYADGVDTLEFLLSLD